MLKHSDGTKRKFGLSGTEWRAIYWFCPKVRNIEAELSNSDCYIVKGTSVGAPAECRLHVDLRLLAIHDMHFLVRAFLLYVFGLAAIAVTVAIGIMIAFSGDVEIIPEGHYWDRIKPIAAFEIVSVATALSMLLPPAYFGASLLTRTEESPTYERGWNRHPELSIFLLNSFVVLPLIAVFPVDDLSLARIFLLSKDEYLWCFFALWWAHGAINAAHVRMLRRRIMRSGLL